MSSVIRKHFLEDRLKTPYSTAHTLIASRVFYIPRTTYNILHTALPYELKHFAVIVLTDKFVLTSYTVK